MKIIRNNLSKPVLNKVLFISHEATRTGAPIVLLHLLKWISKNSSLQFEILLLNGGPLQPDFEQLGKTFLLGNITGQHTYGGRIKKKVFGLTQDELVKKAVSKLSKRGYNLVYGNTIVSLPLLNIFKEDYAIRTLCCVHELPYALNCFFSDEYLKENLSKTDCIIAVSGAVKKHLIDSFKLPAEKISLQYEFIDTDVMPKVNENRKTALGIVTGEYIIGMGGTPSWRKGTDLLIPLIVQLTVLYPGFKFKALWLGADTEDGFIKQLAYDAQKLGIDDKIVFLPNKPDPINYINLFDVFVLLSREDPFPLIVLEAAFLKKPIIAFENSGGIPEFAAQGTGLLSPYLNITKTANLIYQLSQDGNQSCKMGSKGHELVISQHSSTKISPNIYSLIISLINPLVSR